MKSYITLTVSLKHPLDRSSYKFEIRDKECPLHDEHLKWWYIWKGLYILFLFSFVAAPINWLQAEENSFFKKRRDSNNEN